MDAAYGTSFLNGFICLLLQLSSRNTVFGRFRAARLPPCLRQICALANKEILGMKVSVHGREIRLP
jgi:hypothetical protein